MNRTEFRRMVQIRAPLGFYVAIQERGQGSLTIRFLGTTPATPSLRAATEDTLRLWIPVHIHVEHEWIPCPFDLDALAKDALKDSTGPLGVLIDALLELGIIREPPLGLSPEQGQQFLRREAIEWAAETAPPRALAECVHGSDGTVFIEGRIVGRPLNWSLDNDLRFDDSGYVARGPAQTLRLTLERSPVTYLRPTDEFFEVLLISHGFRILANCHIMETSIIRGSSLPSRYELVGYVRDVQSTNGPASPTRERET